jgi:hypothetical protein
MGRKARARHLSSAFCRTRQQILRIPPLLFLARIPLGPEGQSAAALPL